MTEPRAAALPPHFLPGEHFAAAFGCLVLGAAGLVWAAPDLAQGAYLTSRVIGVAHLFTLGFVTMSIMGVLYQFLPVGLAVGIASRRLAHACFTLFLPGVLLFAGGTALEVAPAARAGVGLVAAAALGFVANVWVTLCRAPARGVTWWGVAVGVTNLAGVLGLGVALAVNLETGWLGAARPGASAAHLHLAFAGFVLPVVVGVSHRLLPMFLLAPGVSRRPAAAALVLLGPGAPLLAVGLGFERSGLVLGGAALSVAGVGAFLLQAARYFRARRLPALDPAMGLAASGVAGLAAAALVGLALAALGRRAAGLATAYGLLAVLGVSLFVVGHYYRIVPHFVWRHRFLPLAGRRPVPRAADLVAAAPLRSALALLTGGAATLVAGVLGVGPQGVLARAGAALFAGGAVVVAAQMLGIARHRAEEEPCPH